LKNPLNIKNADLYVKGMGVKQYAITEAFAGWQEIWLCASYQTQ
jgi:hypothetical protein